jgi:hypothetical protein
VILLTETSHTAGQSRFLGSLGGAGRFVGRRRTEAAKRTVAAAPGLVGYCGAVRMFRRASALRPRWSRVFLPLVAVARLG